MIFKINILIHSLHFMLLYNVVSFAQNSFVREMGINLSLQSQYLSQLEEDADGSIHLLYANPNEVEKLNFIKLNEMGVVLNVFTTEIDHDNWASNKYEKKGDFQLSSCYGVTYLENPRTALVVLNSEQEIHWAKQLGLQAVRQDFAGFTNSGKVYCSFYLESNTISENKLGLANFDQQNGNQNWGFYYERLDTPIPNEVQSYIVIDIESFSDNSILVLVKNYHKAAGISGVGNLKEGYGLLHINENGMIIKSIGIDESIFLYDVDIDSDDNLYLGAKIKEENDIFERNPEGIIVKMDKALNVIWKKKLIIDNFSSRNMSIKAKPFGSIIFSHVSHGDLPVITGEITSTGELLWYKGYSFYDPLISIGNDNSIYFTSKKKYYENGTFDYGFIIAKTLPSGEIESCPQFDACLTLEDMELEFEEWQWSREDAPPLPDLPVTLDTAYFSSTPYCGTPTPPRADFVLPDTLCQYECVQPDSVKNRLAHYIEWHIKGPQVDTIIADTSFNWCFELPGHYDISQEVWLLGCSEMYAQSVVVLAEDLEASLGQDRTICTPAPYELAVTAVRPLTQTQWSNGEETMSIEVDTSGSYAVTVTDGYCMDTVGVDLQFLEELITAEPLVLPPDTLICYDFLPYVLRPESPYATLFNLNGSTGLFPEFTLSQPGRYRVGFDLEGCPIERSFLFETTSCDIPIFIPNAFSPNDDGINDLVFPQGQNFEGEKLQIFDRWGGLLYQTKEAPFSWDGFSNGKALNTGVYLLVFTYFNQLNLKEEVKSQEVLLLR